MGQKIYALSGQMIRNLSKNTVELGQEEKEISTSLSAGQINSGQNSLIFTLEVCGLFYCISVVKKIADVL